MIDFVIDYTTNSEDPRSVNSMFKSRDIYNYKIAKRREALESLTSIQSLIRELNDRSNWTYEIKKDDFSHITHLFIIKQTTKLLLKTNHEVLIMNCTYKTNRYNMSLMIISEQIALHTNFYVVFDFMTHEETSDYFWML
jgi:hypothetical protein